MSVIPPTRLVLLLALLPLTARAEVDNTGIKGMELLEAGKYREATVQLEQFIQAHPQLQVIPVARIWTALAYLKLGEPDPALQMLQKALASDLRNLPVSDLEMGAYLLGEAYLEKARVSKADDPARITLLQSAAEAYRAFIEKYPTSPKTKWALFKRAEASMKLGDFSTAENVLTALRKVDLDPELRTEADLLQAEASALAANAKLRDKSAEMNQILPGLIRAETLLTTLLARQGDLVSVNRAWFQLGEAYNLHAHAVPPAEKEGWLRKSEESFRQVQSKGDMVLAQQSRIENLKLRVQQVAVGNAEPRTKAVQIQQLNTLIETEKEKLARLESSPSELQAAQMRMGELYSDHAKYDEARVLFRYLETKAGTQVEQKLLAYRVALSYALQAVAGGGTRERMGAKVVEAYEHFKVDFAQSTGLSSSEELPLLVGVVFLTEPHQDPALAVRYLKEAATVSTKGRVFELAMFQLSRAYQLNHEPGAALEVLQQLLQTMQEPDIKREAALDAAKLLSSEAEHDPAKIEEAIGKLRQVVDADRSTPEAGAACLYLVQLLRKSDPRRAADEAIAFADSQPKSTQAPELLRQAATALQQLKETDASIQLLQRITTEYPDTPAASAAVFSIVSALYEKQQYNEIVTLLDRLIATDPQNVRIADAYFQSAQALQQIANSNPVEQLRKAVDRYAEFQAKYPQQERAPESLLRIVQLEEKILRTLGSYGSLSDPAARELWQQQLERIVKQGELLLTSYPESRQAPSALESLLTAAKKRPTAGHSEDVIRYFEKLRERPENSAQLRSRISFALAKYLYPIDPIRAAAIVRVAYNETITFDPAEMELYATILISNGELEAAAKVYDKLERDFTGAEKSVALEAELVAVIGRAKLAFLRNDLAQTDAWLARFRELTSNQPRSSRHAEIDLITLERAFQNGKEGEVIVTATRLVADKEASAQVKARALFLAAQMYEKSAKFKEAIDHYRKVALRFNTIIEIAPEALFRGGGLLERIAGEEKDKEIRKNHLANAVKSYEPILSSYAETKWAGLAQERLRVLR